MLPVSWSNSTASYWPPFVNAGRCILELKRAVQEEGYTITTSNGNVIQPPLVGAMNRTRDNVLRLGREFGLTPVNRSRIDALPESPADPTTKFLFG
jgi:P27 family predicted phage terminase small subunit